MKKILFFIVVSAMFIGILCFAAFAVETDAATAEVYVTIANKGELAVADEKITVTDKNGDGKINVDETLYAVHESKYEGGAEAGYYSYTSETYGLSLGTLWGDSSGAFGYYINNASSWGLSDEVNNGDHFYAFVYSDGQFFSDSYCFFDKNAVSAVKGNEITLTLFAAGFDADWNPVTYPLEGATVTVDGVATEYKTDAEGKVTIRINDDGEHLISAVSESATLVPPVAIALVGYAPETGDNFAVWTVMAVASACLFAAFAVTKKRYEK